MACTTYKTLQIIYTTTSIMPANGYTVQWRVAGTTTWNVVTGKKANPITIAAVPSCDPLEIQLLADCGDGLQVIDTFGVSSGITGKEYFYYSATKFNCLNSCSQVGDIKSSRVRSSIQLPTDTERYYKVGNYVYRVETISELTSSTYYDVDLSTAPYNNTCSSACAL
jgi:hypothetical protein